ncbi:MAG: DUF4920 domain-containing protein [Candidatus Kapabacteria bacterium]|nr:DUF4920 domain-containing protein [Candidatus Kapabacteria bacterium]
MIPFIKLHFTKLVVSMIMVMFVGGCSRPDYLGVRPDDSNTTLTVSEALRLENLGRTISIRGKVGSVCQDEGCWMTITDGTAELKLRFADHTINAPMDLKGYVLAQGVVRENIVGTARVSEMMATGMIFLQGN